MLMNKIEREQMRQTQPFLSEDQYEEMQYTIGEAMENDSQAGLTLFHEYGNKEITGHPFVENGQLRLRTDEGIETIPLDKLINVEVLSG